MQMIHRCKHSAQVASLITWERLLDGAAGDGGGPAGDEGGRRAGHVRLRVPRLGGVLGPEHARPVPIVGGSHAAARSQAPSRPMIDLFLSPLRQLLLLLCCFHLG
jgi:hypothetical protein